MFESIMIRVFIFFGLSLLAILPTILYRFIYFDIFFIVSTLPFYVVAFLISIFKGKVIFYPLIVGYLVSILYYNYEMYRMRDQEMSYIPASMISYLIFIGVTCGVFLILIFLKNINSD